MSVPLMLIVLLEDLLAYQFQIISNVSHVELDLE